jgi:hypothetical protein
MGRLDPPYTFVPSDALCALGQTADEFATQPGELGPRIEPSQDVRRSNHRTEQQRSRSEHVQRSNNPASGVLQQLDGIGVAQRSSHAGSG